MSRTFFCAHCNHRIIESSDPNMDFIHAYTGNLFCDVTGPKTAVENRGEARRKTAIPKIIEHPAPNQTIGRDRIVAANPTWTEDDEPVYIALMIGYDYPHYRVVLMSAYDYEPLRVERYEHFIDAVKAYSSEGALF